MALPYDQNVMFNFHDIALILVVFQSLLLGALLLSIKEGKIQSHRLIALFVLAIGLEAFDTLIYWCVPLKQLYFQNTPVVFFLFKVALLLQGPLLFFYIKSLIYTDFTLKRRDLYHFLPGLLYPAYAALMLLSLGAHGLRAGASNYDVYWGNLFYRTLVLAQAGLVFAYALASLRLILAYKERLKQNYSNLDKIERNWLKTLIVGFTLIAFWNLLTQLSGMTSSNAVAAAIGLGGNYLDLIFMNLLVFYNLLHSHIVQGVQDPEGQRSESQDSQVGVTQPAPDQAAAAGQPGAAAKLDELAEEQVAAVEQAISRDHIYLSHDLTLEQLAAKVGLSPRATSNIINRHFGMSFFDFVNYHRVETAKAQLLAAPDKSVLEISELSGFNSKSAFNRFFKKFTGATPTEYRRAGGLVGETGA